MPMIHVSLTNQARIWWKKCSGIQPSNRNSGRIRGTSRNLGRVVLTVNWSEEHREHAWETRSLAFSLVAGRFSYANLYTLSWMLPTMTSLHRTTLILSRSLSVAPTQCTIVVWSMAPVSTILRNNTFWLYLSCLKTHTKVPELKLVKLFWIIINSKMAFNLLNLSMKL